MTAKTLKSLLDLAKECDAFPYASDGPDALPKRLYDFTLTTDPNVSLGFVTEKVALALAELPQWQLCNITNDHPTAIALTSGNNEAARSHDIAVTCQLLRESGQWKVLEKWRDELYSVYGPNKEVLFTMERSATPLFGVVTYGVHMTAFTRASGELKLWIPRRSATKQTYPLMLDNTVAGGISAGEKPFESLIRECEEEASLPEAIARKAKAAGCITYFHIREERAGGETGLLQPECQYVYDLDLTNDVGVVCKPNDDEVEGFELMGMAEVMGALRGAKFKPNCAMCTIDFLIRHGVITAENEKDYAEIMSRLHRRLPFPMA